MSDKERFASYAVELTDDGRGSVWITVTQQEPYAVFSAQLVTGTCSVTYETIPTHSSVQRNTYVDPRLLRC